MDSGVSKYSLILKELTVSRGLFKKHHRHALGKTEKVMISIIQDNGKSGRNLNRACAGYKPKKSVDKTTCGLYVVHTPTNALFINLVKSFNLH